MSCCWGGCEVHILKSPWCQVLRSVVIGSLWFPRVAGSLFCSSLQRFAAVVGRRVHFCFAIWPASPCILDRRRSCPAPVSPLSQQSHGAEETFLAQKGVRQEGWQEEVVPPVPPFGQAQLEEGWLQAPFPQAQVQEGGCRGCLDETATLRRGAKLSTSVSH